MFGPLSASAKSPKIAKTTNIFVAPSTTKSDLPLTDMRLLYAAAAAAKLLQSCPRLLYSSCLTLRAWACLVWQHLDSCVWLWSSLRLRRAVRDITCTVPPCTTSDSEFQTHPAGWPQIRRHEASNRRRVLWVSILTPADIPEADKTITK